jgi:hypothetical protein
MPPAAFYGTTGTLLTDRYTAYDTVLDERVRPDREPAACVAHARRELRSKCGGVEAGAGLFTEGSLFNQRP